MRKKRRRKKRKERRGARGLKRKKNRMKEGKVEEMERRGVMKRQLGKERGEREDKWKEGTVIKTEKG